jgi:hypothetical protein
MIDLVRASDDDTITTLNGKRFEKAQVTELTPATITIKDSTSICRLSFSELPYDVRERFGYDEVKAKALTGGAIAPSRGRSLTETGPTAK